jgi:LysM repeat protein
MRRFVPIAAFMACIFAILACSQTGDQVVIYVTATPMPGLPTAEPPLQNPFQPTVTPAGPTATPMQPTPNPTRPQSTATIQYTVQKGDSLAAIAMTFGLSIEDLLRLNPAVTTTTILYPDQILTVPAVPSLMTPDFKLIPDSELVNSPGVRAFDVAGYVRYQPGFLRAYSEIVGGRLLSGAQIVAMIAQQNSVNPRLLLALLEFRGHWITDPAPAADRIDYPMGWRNDQRKGLFRQLSWAADWLNDGYYGWKQRGLLSMDFPDKGRMAFNPVLNPGTVAVQYLLARTSERTVWAQEVSPTGFFATYLSLFGDPFRYAVDPLVPNGLPSPTMQFPFAQGEIWYLTGGPHGGWDAASGWAAVDFAPPKPPDELVAQQGNCYISPAFATAMVAGLVVRSGDGAVVIDLDLDGDERTGWTLTYLHIADQDRVPAGTLVQAGQRIGHPSCEGFNLSAVATHLHIARRYNGEWIAADCWACPPDVLNIPWVMGGWTVKGLPDQIFQGTLIKAGEVRRAEQGRDLPDNQLTW